MNTKEKVFSLMSELSGLETINETDELKTDLAFDSLMLVTMLIRIEDVFEIRLDESDMNPFALLNVSDVIKLIEKYLSQTDA